MAKKHDGYIYGLDSFVFNEKELGYISNDGVSDASEQASSAKIWALQKRTAPVKEIEENPGSVGFEFDLICLTPENMKDVAGGSVSEDGTVWSAPSKNFEVEGPAEIHSADGSVHKFKRVSLRGRPSGAFNYSDVRKVHCIVTVLTPEDGSSPYSIDFDPVKEL